jgi:hypothetical protein
MYNEGDGEKQLTLDMYYKESVNEEFICEDDVRDDHILGFKKFFEKLGYNVDNLMENQWELWQGSGMDDWKAFTPTADMVRSLRTSLEQTGATFNKELCYFDGVDEVEF